MKCNNVHKYRYATRESQRTVIEFQVLLDDLFHGLSVSSNKSLMSQSWHRT